MATLKPFCYALLISLALVSCKKDDASTSTTSQYSDKLTLGTSMSGFTIVGETATFTSSTSNGKADVYWRLECTDDYGNQGARLKIEKLASGVYTAYLTDDPAVLQSYGHIYLHGPLQIPPGTYKATGIHIGSGRQVDVKTFTVN